MKPKKIFGQHFLLNEVIAQQTANLTDNYHNCTNVLEIGPGKGFLTKYLNEKNINLKVVEIDVDAVNYLLHNDVITSNQIVEGNFLELNLKEVFDGEEFLIVGNFPYNISSQIIFKSLEFRELIPAIIGMFQLEVAERIVSPAGNKTYGVISVFTQLHFEGKLHFKVGPENFDPPPKVKSAVIELSRKENEVQVNQSLLKQIVKMSFNSRRKMLRNTLKMFKNENNENLEIWTMRPEQLSPSQFVDLVHLFEEN